MLVYSDGGGNVNGKALDVRLLYSNFTAVPSNLAIAVLQQPAVIKDRFASLDFKIKFVDKALTKANVTQFRLGVLCGLDSYGLYSYGCPARRFMRRRGSLDRRWAACRGALELAAA